jgi:hypothetical protein
MLMHRYLPKPGPVYIETCGTTLVRGEVQGVDAASGHGLMDTWSAHRQGLDRERLQALHYSGASPHSREIVDLCRRLVMSSTNSPVTLIYAHRGHHSQCKTPLLQTLLSQLDAPIQVHGLRTEQDDLPLDVVLFAVAALSQGGRCIIVKDNAIRLGTTEVVPGNTLQYLVLSRSSGPWTITDILINDADRPFMPRATSLSLREFLSDCNQAGDSLSLNAQTTCSTTGSIHLVRTRQPAAVVTSPNLQVPQASKSLAADQPEAATARATAVCAIPQGTHGVTGNA